MIEIAHERRTGIAAGHLLGRTAHIDVDDVGALARCNARRFRHVSSLAPGKLHDVNIEAGMPDPQSRTGPAFRQFAARNHLGDDQTCSVRVGAHAHRVIGDAGHRCEEDPVADGQGADPQRGRQK